MCFGSLDYEQNTYFYLGFDYLKVAKRLWYHMIMYMWFQGTADAKRALKAAQRMWVQGYSVYINLS